VPHRLTYKENVMLHRILLSSLLAAASVPAMAAAEKYDIDPGHSQILFTWNHLGFSNPSGTFEKIGGEFQLDTADLTKSSITVILPLASLHTGVPKLDEHLKTPEFFDASKYPEIRFKSTKVEKSGAEGLKVTGDLSIHGITKPVTLNAKINKIGDNPMMKTKSAGFDADVTLKRSDFGVSYGVPNVSDDIKVHITLSADAAKPAAAAK
jgi:polyisoprenoid-binding protein YceI